MPRINPGKGARAATKRTEDIIESAKKATNVAESGRPIVDRKKPPPSPEDVANLEGMAPEDVARAGATIGQVEPRQAPVEPADEALPDLVPASREQAEQVRMAAIQAQAPQEPRTLLRNVNIDYTYTSDGNKALIDEISRQSKGFMAERRGVVPQAETYETAMNIPEDVTLEALLRRRPGQIWNAEASVAARQALIEAAEVVHTLSRQLTQPVNNKPRLRADVTDEDLLEFRQAVGNLRSIQAAVQGNAAEVGRALNSFKIEVGPAGMLQVAEKMSEMGGRRVSQTMVEGFAALEDVTTIAKAAEATWAAKAFDYAHSYWINALLSGPITHVKNLTGNTSFQLLTMAEAAFAGNVVAPMRRGLAGLGNDWAQRSTQVPGVEPGEATSMWYASVSAWRDALRLARNAYKEQGGIIGSTGKVDTPADRRMVQPTDLIPVDTESPLGKAMNWLDRYIKNAPTNALGAEDEFYKVFAYRASLARNAYRDAQNAVPGDPDFDWMAEQLGLGGPRNFTDDQTLTIQNALMIDMINNPSGELHAAAVDGARYGTFTDNPGKTAEGLMAIRSDVPGFRWIAPFMRTPARLIEAALQRSPFGAATATLDLLTNFQGSELANMIRRGGAEADEAIARLVIGNAVWGLVSVGVMTGDITGKGPPNREVREAMRQQGWQPFSIKVDGKYYSYNNLDPLGMMIAGAASMAEYKRYAENEEDWAAIAFAGTIGVAQNFSTKAYLQGVSDVIAILEAPEGVGPEMMKDFGVNLGGSFVPNLFRQVNPDRTIRDSRRGRDIWHELEMNIQSRMPYLSSNVPPRVDDWGRLITTEAWGVNQISPIRTTTGKYDPVADAARRNGLTPSRPRRFTTFGGQGGRRGAEIDLLDLRDYVSEEGAPPIDRHGWALYEFSKLVGQKRYERVQQLIGTAQWRNAPESFTENEIIDDNGLLVKTRRGLLAQAYTQGMHLAKMEFIEKWPEIKDQIRNPKQKLKTERDIRNLEF